MRKLPIAAAGARADLNSVPVGAQENDRESPAREEASIELASTISLDSDANVLVESTNAFSLDHLREANARDANLIVLPVIASRAVGFAFRGTIGATALQLKSVMRYLELAPRRWG